MQDLTAPAHLHGQVRGRLAIHLGAEHRSGQRKGALEQGTGSAEHGGHALPQLRKMPVVAEAELQPLGMFAQAVAQKAQARQEPRCRTIRARGIDGERVRRDALSRLEAAHGLAGQSCLGAEMPEDRDLVAPGLLRQGAGGGGVEAALRDQAQKGG